MAHEIRVYVWEKPTNIVKCDEIVGLLRKNMMKIKVVKENCLLNCEN